MLMELQLRMKKNAKVFNTICAEYTRDIKKTSTNQHIILFSGEKDIYISPAVSFTQLAVRQFCTELISECKLKRSSVEVI
jgi:hypothetical protein